MVRVERVAIRIAAANQSAILVSPLLGPIMAIEAKGLQPTEHKQVPVSAMRFDVVGHRGRRDNAALETELAKRLDAKLVRAPALPRCCLVQEMPLRRLAHPV
jgi:hypothetical protein